MYAWLMLALLLLGSVGVVGVKGRSATARPGRNDVVKIMDGGNPFPTPKP